MWYNLRHYFTDEAGVRYRAPTCYAESQDGRRWTKPNLGLVEHQGSKRNNLVDKKLGLAYAFSCFIDRLAPYCSRS